MFTLWNTYPLNTPLDGFNLINRSDVFAAIDDKVILPGYTRTDVHCTIP
jgi:hypothetical protein